MAKRRPLPETRPSGEIRVGHVLEELAKLEPESVSCCVTSPPYWSLRKYDAPDAIFNDLSACPHDWEEQEIGGEGYHSAKRWQHLLLPRSLPKRRPRPQVKLRCAICMSPIRSSFAQAPAIACAGSGLMVKRNLRGRRLSLYLSSGSHSLIRCLTPALLG